MDPSNTSAVSSAATATSQCESAYRFQIFPVVIVSLKFLVFSFLIRLSYDTKGELKVLDKEKGLCKGKLELGKGNYF